MKQIKEKILFKDNNKDKQKFNWLKLVTVVLRQLFTIAMTF